MDLAYKIALKNEQIKMMNDLMIVQEKELDKLKNKEFSYEENFDSFIEFLCELTFSKIEETSDTLWASTKFINHSDFTEDYPVFTYRMFNSFFVNTVYKYGIGKDLKEKEEYLLNIFKIYKDFT